MNDELEKLRPEVRKAFDDLYNYRFAGGFDEVWGTIRVELLRLAAENELLRGKCNVLMSAGTRHLGRAERAEAELAALKARIRGACLVPLTAVMLRDGYSLTVSVTMSVNDVDELAGKCVRLVVEE